MTDRFRLRLSESEQREIAQAAQATGQTFSAFIIAAALSAARAINN